MTETAAGADDLGQVPSRVSAHTIFAAVSIEVLLLMPPVRGTEPESYGTARAPLIRSSCSRALRFDDPVAGDADAGREATEIA